MNQQTLQEEYEDIKMKLLMVRFAELEGKMLQKENEELSKDSFYQPSKHEKKRFNRRLNLQFTFLYITKTMRSLLLINRPKVAIVVFLLLMSLIATTLSVEAWRVKVLNMFMQVKKEHTELRLEPDSQQFEENHPHLDLDHAFAPAEVPMGYLISEIKDLQNMKMIKYENDDKDYILFQQNSENISLNIDTEDADEVKDITIHGQVGLVVLKNDQITVVWHDEAQMFFIVGNLTKVSESTLIRMAESVESQK